MSRSVVERFQLTAWPTGKKRRRNTDVSAYHGQRSSQLTTIPLEIQLMILSHLDLESMVRLRQTCHLYRHIITVDLVKSQFIQHGQHHAALRACCCECLSMPGLGRLILDPRRSSLVWRSMCFTCWRHKLDLHYQRKHGPLLQFANHYHGYMCHFCAYPVCAADMDSSLQLFHSRCRVKRLLIAVLWFVLTFIQVGLGILGAVLGWTVYKHHPSVLIPSSIDFGLSILALGLLIVRICTVDEQKYSWALATELGMTVVRIPPVIYTARESVVPEKYSSSRLLPLLQFASGIFLLNLVMRFLDTIGYALLYFGYDPRNFLLVGLSKRRKILYACCTSLVWWACVPN
ncbi:uncharacterized protein BCR38DRAFT_117128 [Pseudomassariella vexata]|uniref:F-box domain-containing protein n=1 Tax=Pseudomassariella vexata TaxID=1141098 RepID=A0A1Y2DAK1_9PEZI|nr:uncharacterized protein BCR38DRAFT_117128 [Pseudomassariella vexata]ORY56302.1 hypothetical protein BCR38DRAFT_117128 [Pseudomassariella vexata]